MQPQPTKSVDVAIIGGGIAGLTVAYRLRQRSPELRIALLEASDRLGGKILSETIESDHGRFVVEAGPDAFLVQKPWAKQLADDLGLSDQLMPINSVPSPVSILRGGKPVPLPEGVSLIAPTKFGPFLRSSLMSTSGKARVLREMRVPVSQTDGDESISAFVGRRLGTEAVDLLAEPLLAGIYNAEPERMSLLATFPQFRKLEREHGSLISGLRASARANQGKPKSPAFVTFRNGMQTLVDRLTHEVRAIAETNTTVERLTRTATGDYLLNLSGNTHLTAKSVITTLPSIDNARLLESVAPDSASELARLRTVGAGSISLAYRTEDLKHPLTGYGLVIPRQEHRPINAITVASSKFDGRAPNGWSLLRLFFGGARSAETMFHNDERLHTVVQEQLSDLLGVTAEPLFTRVYRWRTGSPQYDVGHLDRMAAIDAALPSGLHIVGGAYHGVGIPDIARAALSVAERVSGERRPSPPTPLPLRRRGENSPTVGAPAEIINSQPTFDQPSTAQ